MATQPAAEEGEVTLLGPGVGESVVVHLGSGSWLVVDSCWDAEANASAPLNYLRSIGVNVEKDVKLVVGSHCDQDHTIGLVDLLREAKSASVALPLAFTDRTFTSLVHACNTSLRDSSELKYFGEVIKLLDARKVVPIRAQAQTTLLTKPCTVLALSPSPAEVNDSLNWIAAQSSAPDQRLQVRPPTPNASSIALCVRIGRHDILLGADVENPNDAARGWKAICAQQRGSVSPAIVFKIPHHGSPNAHSDEAWAAFVAPDAKVCVTSFARGTTPRPSPEDVARICGMGRPAYATSMPKNAEFEAVYGRTIARAAEKLKVPVRRVRARSCGRVTIRWAIGKDISSGSVSLDGGAIPLRVGGTAAKKTVH